mmetsp:Transcript_17148/g.28211  ORF Transcript_17148/g.28211 Transcript_17148/m.28211 type:complete len:304 (+) Transcript_17148:152-1063(+)|eukprot:CAMPEP_0184647000 /NCGR_PEP_ID=MMETSP0308-20130426/3836_1 /TAXON_ID=38269 /ORGANISM="Gloeochaete witrockiana, Strain SAG 46.84" /LENGTH=303 /DNA_ID=CAMNT_0027077571 /DNA_START=64 /DNA_END=975 /DNA_ORIENTATION=+
MPWAKGHVSGTAPSPRGGHAAAAIDNRIYIFGGADREGTVFGDLIALEIAAPDSLKWVKVHFKGTAPQSRTGHTLVAFKKRLYLFGGQDPLESVVFNDLFEFDTDTSTWSKPSQSGAIPPPRNSHTAVVLDGHMVVVAGANEEGPLDDSYTLDLETFVWTRIKSSRSIPEAREMHTSIPFGVNKVLVHGGRTLHGVMGDTHILDLETSEWSKASPTPFFRCAHVLTELEPFKEALLFGGTDCGRVYSDSWILKLGDTMSWTENPVKTSASRFAHTCTVVDGRAYVIAGINFESDLSDVMVFSR